MVNDESYNHYRTSGGYWLSYRIVCFFMISMKTWSESESVHGKFITWTKIQSLLIMSWTLRSFNQFRILGYDCHRSFECISITIWYLRHPSGTDQNCQGLFGPRLDCLELNCNDFWQSPHTRIKERQPVSYRHLGLSSLHFAYRTKWDTRQCLPQLSLDWLWHFCQCHGQYSRQFCWQGSRGHRFSSCRSLLPLGSPSQTYSARICPCLRCRQEVSA